MLSIKVWLRRPQCVAGLTRRVCQVSRYGLNDPQSVAGSTRRVCGVSRYGLDDPSVLQVVQDEYAKYQGVA